MLLLGLALVLLSGTFAGLLIAENLSGGPEYAATVLGFKLPALSMLGAFLAGLALAFLVCLGLWLVAASSRRRRVATAKYRAARADAESAAAERDQLAHKLERERSTRVIPATPAPVDGDAASTARHRRVFRAADAPAKAERDQDVTASK